MFFDIDFDIQEISNYYYNIFYLSNFKLLKNCYYVLL